MIRPPKKRSRKYMTRPARKYMKLVLQKRYRDVISWRQRINLQISVVDSMKIGNPEDDYEIKLNAMLLNETFLSSIDWNKNVSAKVYIYLRQYFCRSWKANYYQSCKKGFKRQQINCNDPLVLCKYLFHHYRCI